MSTSRCINLFKLINTADVTVVNGVEAEDFTMDTNLFYSPTQAVVCRLSLADETAVYFTDQPVDLAEDGTCMAWSFPNPDDDDEPSTATHLLFTVSRPLTPDDL